jgi:hypothetical protein
LLHFPLSSPLKVLCFFKKKCTARFTLPGNPLGIAPGKSLTAGLGPAAESNFFQIMGIFFNRIHTPFPFQFEGFCHDAKFQHPDFIAY